MKEELNIAVCEWRGWKVTTESCGIPPENLRDTRQFKNHGYDYLPSHITGIEALGNIHEAEKGLTEEQLLEYERHLRLNSAIRWPFHATARQRVIALLRVVKPEIFQ